MFWRGVWGVCVLSVHVGPGSFSFCPPAQFESKRVSADELEQYLHQAELGAKEAEGRALAQADAGACCWGQALHCRCGGGNHLRCCCQSHTFPLWAGSRGAAERRRGCALG